MQNVKVIIGASYGDEGKGLATDFFAARAAGALRNSGSGVAIGSYPMTGMPIATDKGDRAIINVLTNGGPQRGHTVELADGRKHVFKHFGAASFRGAASYYAPQFMVNPMEFIREFDVLRDMHTLPEAYMHPDCRFTTPWDMLVNQHILAQKGIHNSCGFGIWETVLRYDRGYGVPFRVLAAMERDDRIKYLRQLRDTYYAKRLSEVKIENPPAFFYSDDLLFHFEEDCESVRYLCPMRGEEFLGHYQTILFENAQGLKLDGNAKEEQDFTTPSTTGVGRILQTVERVLQGADVEVCYVTRSYLTRHGDGSMENELTQDALRRKMPGIRPDATNVENRFQGILRYGMMDVDLLAARIEADFAQCRGVRADGALQQGIRSDDALRQRARADCTLQQGKSGDGAQQQETQTGGVPRQGIQTDHGQRRRTARNHYHPSVMVTHMNEFAGIDTDWLAERFGTLYLSDGKTDRDVITASA